MFKYDERIEKFAKTALEKAKPYFERIDEITEYNQQKVLKAFIDNRVSEAMFGVSTGYGYGDRGREALDAVVAQSMGAEDAIIRHQFTCGTHTLGTALFGLLRPGDTMLVVTGRPYDTICPVIGITEKKGQGSLADFGINYAQVDLNSDGLLNYEAIKKAVDEIKPRMVYVQLSRGYTIRKSFSVAEISKVAEIAHSCENTIVMVDNCYGEFVEKTEPTECGADIMAGSLIKNPGGGIARSGGYICGKKELVELCAYRYSVAGLGREVGASLGNTREMFMGWFNAPHVTGETLKTAVFSAALFEEMGFEATPKFDESRHDIVQAIKLENSENLIAFCKGLQSGSPIDSFVVPEPWDMPGYPNKVIMAAGAFTGGSTVELSGDAPLRAPFAVWHQGGLNFHSAKVGIMLAAQQVLRTMNK
ncbi:MAG TPA: hypothetical protein GXZ23_08330 [Clostridiales bacterium]|nr:hypothetical protein [Clostridiales bacterium]